MNDGRSFGLKPGIVEAIVHTIRSFGSVRKIILFGSRASGSYTEVSDIDIAVDCDFDLGPVMVALDELDTLLKIDLVHLGHVPEQFRDEILQEGTVIYEAP